MNKKDLLLHALSRYRSALPPDIKTAWSTRHSYDIALALFQCARSLVPSEEAHFIVHVDKNSGEVLYLCISLCGTSIDFFGSGAHERAQDSIFNEEIELETVNCPNPEKLQEELNNRDYFTSYWDSPIGFQSALSSDILEAAHDYLT